LLRRESHREILSLEEVELLNSLADLAGKSRSELIREIIAKGIASGEVLEGIKATQEARKIEMEKLRAKIIPGGSVEHR